MSAPAHAQFWIGPSGWSYPDWQGCFYPKPKPRGFKALRFVSRYFNAVEVNSSFYAIPSPKTTERWASEVPEAFRFAFKLTQTFTHERDAVPHASDVARFREALTPVRDAGRLGPLLIQFPWSFRYGRPALEQVHRLADAFPDCERAIEVRHSSWAAPERLAELARFGGVCSIDQPRLRDCLPPISAVHGGTAYVRLHGRNAANWFADDASGAARYDYLYDETELREWADRLDGIASQSREVYVFANNHFRGQAPANALELRALLTRQSVAVPEPLLTTYPRLGRIALPPPQSRLF